MFSCAKVETYSPGITDDSDGVNISIVNENGNIEATKSYFYETPAYWSFSWEDMDSFRYFFYSRNNLVGYRTTYALKTPDATFISYDASDLDVGNTIYSYFVQESMKEFSQTNVDPSSIMMNIPTLQVTTKDAESFRTPIDPSFDLLDIHLDADYENGHIGPLEGVPSRTLYFKIDNFNPDFTYLCKNEGEEGGFSDFTYDENGNASVTILFDKITPPSSESIVEVRIYNGDFSKNYVTVEVEAYRPRGNVYEYYCSKGSRSTRTEYATSSGDEKPYPIRDAMPCASVAKTVTYSLLKYPEDIANSMTMYMLGSAAEFRIYSKNAKRTGEKIEQVILTTINQPCAGYCYYNLLDQDLEISGYDQDTITSDVSLCGYYVPTVKGDEESVYMVLAPGTYDIEINVITTDSDGVSWNNVLTASNQTFTRAMRKPFAVNLDSSSAVRFPVAKPNGYNEEEEEL